MLGRASLAIRVFKTTYMNAIARNRVTDDNDIASAMMADGGEEIRAWTRSSVPKERMS